MDTIKIRNQFTEAQSQFPQMEIYQYSAGGLYIKAAIQTLVRFYIIAIYFPDNYPYDMPTVHIQKPAVTNSAHMYKAGNICYLHPSMWNPGKHNIQFVVARTAKWLSKYEVWKATGRWPGASIEHN